MQTIGKLSVRVAHGQCLVWTNISNPITTSGGKRTKRKPVSLTTATAAITRTTSASNRQYDSTPGTESSSSLVSVVFSARSKATATFFQASDRTASSTVPKMIPGGYHQLLTPTASGSSPAEIAGAIGDRSVKIIASAPTTV